jgi:hypothetical protein
MHVRGIVAACSLVLALAMLGSAPAGAADSGTVSLHNWQRSFCLDVSGWFGSLRSPTPTAGEPPRITATRYVTDIITRSRQELGLDRSGSPPVRGGRAVRATIDDGFAAARARFELALGLAKKLPAATDSKFDAQARAINRRLQQGVDHIITTLHTVHGHTGNHAFDRAILANHQCDYIDELAPSTGSTA